MGKRRGRPRKDPATKVKKLTVSVSPEQHEAIETIRAHLNRNLPVDITRSEMTRAAYSYLAELDTVEILERLAALKRARPCQTLESQGTVPSMPARDTVKTTFPPSVEAPLARGLHDSERKRCYLFDDLRTDDGDLLPVITIGRGTRCDIRLSHSRVSKVHAVLRRTGDGVRIHDHLSTNKIWVDQTIVTEPVLLRVGMRIHLGPHYVLIASDAKGAFPICAYTVSDLCRQAARDYGTDVLAGERLGKSHEYIRRQRIRRMRRAGTTSEQ